MRLPGRSNQSGRAGAPRATATVGRPHVAGAGHTPPRARAADFELNQAQRALQAAVADRSIFEETPISTAAHGAAPVREAG